MTGPGRPGQHDPTAPPEWFVKARQASERTAVFAPVPGPPTAGQPVPGPPAGGQRVPGPPVPGPTVPAPPAVGPPLPGSNFGTITPDADLDDASITVQVDALTVQVDPQMKTSTTAGVVRAGALMAVATVISRVTGLLSKMAILAILGVNFTSTAYTVANTLPNIVFELLIGGVLTSVAIPLLTRAQRSDPDGGLEYTQRLLTIAFVGLAVATVVAVACAPLLAHLYLSPRDSGSRQTTELTTQFSRLLLPQMFFYGIAALFGAILNTKERFAANAWAPVVNNVLVIGVAVVLWVGNFRRGEMTTNEMLILGIGTTLGIVLQALVMIPALLRSGFRFRWRWGWDPRLTEAGGLVGWAIVYVLVSQVGVVVTTNVANGHSAGGPVTFSYASLLFQMPYGILGVAVLTAIMPRLSRHAAAGRMADVKDDVSLANRLSAVALLPVSAALAVLGTAGSIALFRYKNVTLDAAQQIGLTISVLAIGLLPLAMTLVQMRVFYATKDGRTPTLINVVMVAVRVPLLLASVQLKPTWVIPGLAAATVISYVVGAIVGECWLRARFGPMGTHRTLTTISKMFVASAAGGAAAYFAVRGTVGLHPIDTVQALLELLVGGIVGLVVLAGGVAVLKVSELQPVYRRLLRLTGRRPVPVGGVAVPAVPTPAAGMAGSARSLSQHPPQPGRAQQRPADGPTIRKQVSPRVSNPDADGRSGPTPEPAAAAPPGATAAATDPLADDTTARPGGAATVDDTLHLGPFVELAPGATVGGRYRLVSLVAGDDAGNRFWRAKDTVLPRDMAVTLLPEGNATAATVARTLRVGRLHHIGLPQTLDVGTEQGQSYVVGQWVDGATLTDLLAGGPLEPDVATSITAKVSEAVAEAHRNGIALGAINPSLVRVNFDGQVRLSHVIANGSATPDQDIRAVGGLLYLMLTGLWPLPGASNTVEAGGPGSGSTLGTTAGIGQLTAAPTRLGREVPAAEVRPTVPTALSALAERALHPDDPAGIHAVSAIASLLRQPEAATPATAPAEEPARPVLNPAERRLVRERRAKLGVASVMIAAFSALIIIVVASLSKQVLDGVAGPTVTSVSQLSVAPDAPTRTAPAKTTPKPATSKPATTGATKSATTAATSTAPAAATVQQITDATVYDPMGDGVKDNTDQVPQAFDGNQQTFWPTFPYKLQFPSTLKPGVGLTLVFANPVTPTSVTVTSDTPTTTIEVRSAAGPDLPYAQTTPLGRGEITSGTPGLPGSTTIAVANAPRSRYLVVFVVGMAPKGQRFQAHLNEITVSGS